MRDFICCEQTWPNLHDLLQHYEEVHTEIYPNPTGHAPSFNVSQTSTRLPQARQAAALTASSNLAAPAPNSSQLGQQNRQAGPFSSGPLGGGLSSTGLSMMSSQHGVPNAASQGHSQFTSHMADEMDALGDMEMDEAVGPLELDDSQQRTLHHTRQMFGQVPRPQLHLNASGITQGLRTSQPPTPAAASFGLQHNPTVSSVNTPTLATQQSLQQRSQPAYGVRGPAVPLLVPEDELAFGGMNLNGNNGFAAFTADDPDTFIDEPGKHLFGSGNPPTSQQQALRALLAQQPMDQTQVGDANQVAMLQRMMMEEHKPYKCPVIGCEKAYKNQNGLKYVEEPKQQNSCLVVTNRFSTRYHKQHGHQNQLLHENPDGTFSIMNPETQAPYPGTVGMEKEKPFKCDFCHKRYKNLNGLKYVRFPVVLVPSDARLLTSAQHKTHSPLCVPGFHDSIQQMAANANTGLAGLGQTIPGGLQGGMPGNLPYINEDDQMT
jgi:transcription factor SFP1